MAWPPAGPNVEPDDPMTLARNDMHDENRELPLRLSLPLVLLSS